MSATEPKKYDKLVRDRIPEIIRLRGGVPVYRQADAEEYRRRLGDKLCEEAAEYAKAEDADQAKEELADVLEVVHAAAEALGASMHDIEALRVRKAEERGAFKERLVLEQA